MFGSEGATVAGLRAWARGNYAYEAAVELLMRNFGGRFAEGDGPGAGWMNGRGHDGLIRTRSAWKRVFYLR